MATKKTQMKLKTEIEQQQEAFVHQGQVTPTATGAGIGAGAGKEVDPREKRTAPHTTMFTPEEWAAIRKAAFDQGTPHSDVIREAVCKHLGIEFDRAARK